MYIGSTVQVIRGFYKWSIGTVISVSADDIVLVEIDDGVFISCDIEDLDEFSEGW